LGITITDQVPVGEYVAIVEEEEDSVNTADLACASGSQFKGNIGNISTADFGDWIIGDTGVATDTRNGQDYCVGMLADNHIWMLNNLKLGSATESLVTINNQGNPVTIPQVSALIDVQYEQPRIYGPVPGQSNDITSETFYGYLYNWCAAKAGLSDSCTPYLIYPTPSGVDICPVGWRLPIGGEIGDPSNEFDVLNAKMAGYDDNGAIYQSEFYYSRPELFVNWQFEGPFRGVFAGRTQVTSFMYQGEYGEVWSGSELPLSSNALSVNYDPSYIDTRSAASRGGASSIRCILNYSIPT
jgi:uncharacterized protein (TIGR02145 family)